MTTPDPLRPRNPSTRGRTFVARAFSPGERTIAPSTYSPKVRTIVARTSSPGGRTIVARGFSSWSAMPLMNSARRAGVPRITDPRWCQNPARPLRRIAMSGVSHPLPAGIPSRAPLVSSSPVSSSLAAWHGPRSRGHALAQVADVRIHSCTHRIPLQVTI